MDAMCPRLALIGYALAAGAFWLVASSQECDSKEAIQTIQRTCKQQEQDMLVAEMSGGKMEVCRHFPLQMICAVTAVPHCYDFIERTFSPYTHSPFSCELTPEVIQELQEIVRKGQHVTELPTSTIPATVTLTTTEQKEESGTTFHDNLTSEKAELHPGSKQKHEGAHTHGHDDGSQVTHNISTMVGLLLATVFLQGLTS